MVELVEKTKGQGESMMGGEKRTGRGEEIKEQEGLCLGIGYPAVTPL